MASDKYKYAAFVSYKHRPDDRRWANWLINALETFETPFPLVHKGYPARIGRLFRDDAELTASNNLREKITEALWLSRHLIVVCGEDTPTSDWVRAEIALFQHWGRSENIHVLLINHKPAVSIPAELRFWDVRGKGVDSKTEMVEPAAACVASDNTRSEDEIKSLAMEKLASALIGCDFSELRDRQLERERDETSYTYFENMTFRRGVPHGIGEITSKSVTKRSITYCFESRKGLVRNIKRINGVYELVNNNNDISKWSLSYRADGSVEAIEHRNKSGICKLIEKMNKDASVVDYVQDDDQASAQGTILVNMGFEQEKYIELCQKKAEITRHKTIYNEKGFVVRRLYYKNSFNEKAQDSMGNFGEAYDVDERGLPIKTWYLDHNGERALLTSGVAVRTNQYDDCGRLKRSTFLDGKLCPVMGAGGYCAILRKYDALGNEVQTSNLDTRGRLCLGNDFSCYYITTYDNNGNRRSRTFYDVSDNPTLNNLGYARITWENDARGNVTEAAYFGLDAEPVLHKDGYARITREHDARGNVTEETYFGLDAKPVLYKDGYARITCENDARGNVTEATYFGLDAKPVLHRDGYARITREHDARGNVTEETYFGLDEEPVLYKDGYARTTWEHDARGNVTEAAYFGLDAEPVLYKDGYARTTREHDARGNVTEETYFGLDAEPVLYKGGYARITWEHDARGNVTEEAYFGLDAEPVLHKNGYARTAWEHDARGNETEETYFGLDAEPVLHEDGYARTTWEHDARGNETEETYFGLDAEPVLHKNGYARIAREYDNQGEVLIYKSFDIEGRLVSFKNQPRQELIQKYTNECNLIKAVDLGRLDVKEVEAMELKISGKLGLATAEKLGNLSYHYLLANEPKEALHLSLQAIDLAPDQLWLSTNYAHSLLFLGKKKEAVKVYLLHREKSLSKDTLWERAVIDDFAEFRQAGVIIEGFDEIERLFEEQVNAPRR